MPDSVCVELRLSQHDDETLRNFEAALAVLPEAIEAFLVTGEYDYVLRVASSGTEGLRALPSRKGVQTAGDEPLTEQFCAQMLEADVFGPGTASL